MLISEEYKEQVQTLHREAPRWGTSGRDFAQIVVEIVRNSHPETILDYGCGKQTLARALPEMRIIGYDPGMPGLQDTPRPADLVTCMDVLEHIEPVYLDDVLDDLQRVTKRVVFLVVGTAPAFQILPDGRNAHLIIEPFQWWLPKLMERFDVVSMTVYEGQFHALMKAKNPKGNGNG